MAQGKKIYVIAGEASGDLHASNLMAAMLERDPNLDFRFWGGDKMAEVHSGLVKHIRDLAFMGFWEVITNIRTILKNISFCKEDILAYEPDAILLVDYPGFNLRIAEWAHEKGIKVIYYISPQVWAWKQKRVHKIKQVVDKMFVILPFEKEFYERFNYDVTYVGHPLLDEIAKHGFSEEQRKAFYAKHELDARPIIAVLPGSRRQEVSKKLPIMLDALKPFTEYQVVIAGAPSLDEAFYAPFNSENVKMISNETYHLLQSSEAAVVTSGTATLETALFKVPEVVCYKSSRFSYEIAKRLVKVKYISLVNLIMDREVVRELIQGDCNSEAIREELSKLLKDDAYRAALMKNYDELEVILGGGGASDKVAESLLLELK
ncbi:MAG: lipid-A-disaccharide synthase [Flavobacteriales bacterium]|nr:lipid-A-disaccharide synthase [Flavobacteriales bacterium]PIE86879.1 MAG: lipid-A-disaccharide synthase [Bacteroidota bacterium]